MKRRYDSPPLRSWSDPGSRRDAAPGCSADAQHKGDAAAPLAEPSARSLPPPDRPLQVLVVDDVASNRLLLQGILTARGHHVTLAVDGLEATAMVARTSFDVILMDLQMPRFDGVSAASLVRHYERLQGLVRTPIVAVTQNHGPEHRERCASVGFDDVVAKPVSAAHILRVVEGQGAAKRRAQNVCDRRT